MTELVHYWSPFNRTLWMHFWIESVHYLQVNRLCNSEVRPYSEDVNWKNWKSIARIAVLKEWLVWTRSRWLNRLLPIKVESHGWTHPLPHHGQWLQTRCSTWKLRILFGDKVSSLWRIVCGCFCCWITWCTSPWKMKSWILKFWLFGRCSSSSWHLGFSPKKDFRRQIGSKDRGNMPLVYQSMDGWNFYGIYKNISWPRKSFFSIPRILRVRYSPKVQ